MKQALQLPPAVAAKLAKTSPPLNTSKDSSPSERHDEAGSTKGFFDNADADATSPYVSIHPVVLSTA